MGDALTLADRVHQVVVALGKVPRIHKLSSLTRSLLNEILKRTEFIELQLFVLVQIERLHKLLSHLDHLVKFF